MTALDTRAAVVLARLVEAGKIRSTWLPGMLLSGRDRGCNQRHGTVFAAHPPDRVLIIDAGGNEYPIIDSQPDLSDALTVQGLLLLAREAHGCPALCVAAEIHGDGPVIWTHWAPPGARPAWMNILHRYPTEAAAIVAALEAA